jgi:hypothetical protein
MAKLDKNLFDEIVEEMMKEKKTQGEMMAELDCDEQDIVDSYERLAKRRQAAMFTDPKAAGGKQQDQGKKQQQGQDKAAAAPKTAKEGGGAPKK